MGEPVTTANGRVLFGGRGIEPDVAVKPFETTALRFRINEAAFFFVRQLVAGKVQGFENFRVEKQDQNPNLKADELQISDKLFEAFRQYTLGVKDAGLSADNLNSQVEFSKNRLREELATANHSNEAGVQVLLEVDPQIVKAIESMPDARKMLEQYVVMK